MKKLFFPVILVLALLMTGWIISCERDSNTAPASKDSGAPEASVRLLQIGQLLPDVKISSVTLLAGKTMNAGTVEVYQTDTNNDKEYDAFKVVYNLIDGWQFQGGQAAKFYLGLTVPTDDTPGQFPYLCTPGAGTTTFSKTFSFTQFSFECTLVKIYIAAHADLQKLKSDGVTYDTQTGWGEGTKFNDVHGNWSMYYSFDLTDKTPPQASDVVTSVECKADVKKADPEIITDATDDCGLATPAVTFIDEVTNGNTCPEIITRRFLVTDAAGNTTTVQESVIVYDMTKPVLSGQGENVDLACTAQFTPPTAKDNCDGSPVIRYTDNETKNSAGKVASVTRTWTATDACGNVSEPVSQTIILDVDAPVLATKGDNMTIACSAVPSFTEPTFTDNSGKATIVTIAGNDVVETIDTYGSKATTRSWVATDRCGNVSGQVSQTIINNCVPVDPGWLPGTGTGWAYDKDNATAFNTIANKTSNNWGWTNKLTYGKHTYTLFVGAGQSIVSKGTPVGSVTVDYSLAGIVVEFKVISVCKLTGVQVWAGKTLLPLNKQKAYVSAPGQLGFNSGSISTSSYKFNLPNTFGSADIYFAGHADVVIK